MLRRYVYRPANVLTTCGHGPTGQSHGRAGDVVELDDERRDTYLRLIPGANGGLCLIPEDDLDQHRRICCGAPVAVNCACRQVRTAPPPEPAPAAEPDPIVAQAPEPAPAPESKKRRKNKTAPAAEG